jgi:hypothetical protein
LLARFDLLQKFRGCARVERLIERGPRQLEFTEGARVRGFRVPCVELPLLCRGEAGIAPRRPRRRGVAR